VATKRLNVFFGNVFLEICFVLCGVFGNLVFVNLRFWKFCKFVLGKFAVFCFFSFDFSFYLALIL